VLKPGLDRELKHALRATIENIPMYICMYVYIYRYIYVGMYVYMYIKI